ncbi:MAG: hypothetical protein E6I92_05420 [Chloroflexi bacterium]|nr:MAG: hypothetical protein E6I92_05420 [Chloroflexota bacterium]
MHAAPQLETEFESFSSARGRVARGVGLIAASVITLLVTAALYVRPGFDLFARPATSVPALSGDYRVAAMDFVNGTTGWLVVDFPSGDYAVIHTADAGTSWSQQLTAASEGHAKYLKFFDQSVGVFALVGTRPVLRRTSDGRGRSSTPTMAGCSLPAPAPQIPHRPGCTARTTEAEPGLTSGPRCPSPIAPSRSTSPTSPPAG